MNLSATPRRPACPSRASGWSSLTTPWGFPCCVRFPCVHAVATTPAQRLGVLFALLHPAVSDFLERVVGSACAIAQRSLAFGLHTRLSPIRDTRGGVNSSLGRGRNRNQPQSGRGNGRA